MQPTTAVVIPILNAARFARHQVAAIARQKIRPHRCIVIDSESQDDSPTIFKDAGFQVITVPRCSFSHGGTRNMGIRLAPEADILCYFTQDAILNTENSLGNLIRPFEDSAVGIVYGRQLPRADASEIERHSRLFNYPPVNSVRTMKNLSGIKSVFNSNAFAAYRRSALVEIGGFQTKTIMGEDQVAAGMMLLAGHYVVYAANSEVIHSHPYSLVEEFRRYFDIGVFQKQNRSLLRQFGSANPEGRRYVASELTHLLRFSPTKIPEAILRTALKLSGYKIGAFEKYLPRKLKVQLAMQKNFYGETSNQND